MKTFTFKIFPIFIILTSACISEPKHSKDIQDFTLTVEFQPSMFRSGICTIKKEGLIQSISLDFIYGSKKRIPPDYALVDIIDLKRFSTNLTLSYYGDTLYIDPVEIVNLESEHIIQFFKELPGDIATQKGMDLSMPKIDGFEIFFNYKTDSIDHSFAFASVGKFDTTELKIAKAVIELMDRSFKNELAKKYIYTWKISYGFYDLPDTHDYLPILKINVP